MIVENLSPREQRILAVGLSVALALAFLLLFLLPAIRWASDELEGLAAARERRIRLEAIVARAATTPRQANGYASILLSASDAEDASARAISTVREIAGFASVTDIRVEAIEAAPANTVSLSIEARAPVDSLVIFVGRLETGSPRYFLREWKIDAADGGEIASFRAIADLVWTEQKGE